jgi:hypothetical protein
MKKWVSFRQILSGNEKRIKNSDCIRCISNRVLSNGPYRDALIEKADYKRILKE